ncbi:GntR family transcriptional regulator [Streptomyces sp. H10-C2]|uniref:GntR family transcriptional regulator n=1 Tax=unclassified Streptomyces TaxID=2593676 RepID=UPI0024B8F60A|nr:MULTISPECIES: GntR family transcriptional regulator [unclassified Streptomyces]MDJ0346894.1 GntR family transcriptional regulator [Streptomyces sp. PH10-H1]MDJ0370684.1 GntR family transcriptional regulator [Streptomyces sp. H10-C2]
MTAGLRKRDRIREHLISLIEARAVGQAIPAERRLCVELETSRPTLRAVVDELVKDGWLVREHGRGVFVGSPKISQRIVTAPAAGQSGYPAAPGTWTSRVLGHSVIPAGMSIGSRLRVEAATPVLRVARQRRVDGEPMALETIHVLSELVPGASADDVESGSFYALLRDRYGIEPTAAEQVHEAVAADTVQASLLGISAGAPVLSSERVTRDQHGRLFEYTHAIYRGDRYRLVSQLALSGPADAEGPQVTPTV